MAVQFTLDPAASDRLFGLWADDTTPADVEFTAAGQAVANSEPTWRVDLPVEPAAASAILETAQERLDRTRSGLAVAPDRLAEWLERDDTGVAELDARLEYGVLADHRGRQLREAAEVIGLFVRSCAPTAWLETHSGGRVVARSRMALSGSVSTVVVRGNTDGTARHQEALVVTAASRTTAVCAAAVTVHSAVAIAARLSLPGGPLLALPLAWRLLQRITAEHGNRLEGSDE